MIKLKIYSRAAGMIWICTAAVLMSSCTVFKPSSRDVEAYVNTLGTYKLYNESSASYLDRWWESFGDDQLNRLVADALDGNLSLQQARARLQQAWMAAAQQGALNSLSLNLEGSAGTSKDHKDTPEGTLETSAESYSLGLAAGYELDLWGRLSAMEKSAELDAKASEADRNTIASTLAGEVALNYLQLLLQRETLDIINRQLETAKNGLELVELRFRRSQATALDVLQQREAVAQIEALIPGVKANEEVLLQKLAILLGQSPQTVLDIKGRRLPTLPNQPVAGVPADLLARRPDIRRSGLRLRAADWSLSAGRADRLPAIRLTASAKYSSADAGALFDNWLANLAGSLVGPMLDGGRRKAESMRLEQVVNERLAAYKETVINAIGEVQESMIREYRQTEYMEALQKQLAASEDTLGEALSRYRKGVETYLAVLSAQTGEQRVARELAQASYQRLAYRVQLYRALGGDWNDILDDSENESLRKEEK